MFNILCSYKTEDFHYNHTITDSPTKIPLSLELHKDFELYYFIRGDSVSYYIEGSEYSITNGGLLVISTGESHRPLFKFDNTYEKIIIHFSENLVKPFQTEEFSLLSLFSKTKSNSKNFFTPNITRNLNIEESLLSIEKYIKNPVPESKIMIKLIFFNILVSLNKVFNEDTSQNSEIKKSNKKILEILDYINNHLNEDITLAVLEEQFFLNKYYLCHTFKNYTGFSVLEYTNYKRIVHARDLIRHKIPATEACYMVGFKNYSSFYRAYKRLTGKAPKDVSY